MDGKRKRGGNTPQRLSEADSERRPRQSLDTASGATTMPARLSRYTAMASAGASAKRISTAAQDTAATPAATTP